MLIIGFNGSAHARGNTQILLSHCLATLEREGVGTEFIQVGGSGIHPCRGCNACRARDATGLCAMRDDALNAWYEKVLEADGFILATPTYCWAPTPEIKCLVDRFVYLARAGLRAGTFSNPLRHKVGAAIAVDAYSGAPQAIQILQAMFATTQMITPGAAYWPMGKGINPGDVKNDSAGLGYVEDLARNMAWLLRKIHA